MFCFLVMSSVSIRIMFGIKKKKLIFSIKEKIGMFLHSSHIFWMSLCKTDIISFLTVWLNSPVKPYYLKISLWQDFNYKFNCF